MKFIVEKKGQYIYGFSCWPAYVWTDDKSKAMTFDDPEFFRKHYPQFTLIEVSQ